MVIDSESRDSVAHRISMRLMHNLAAPPVRPLGMEGDRRLLCRDQGRAFRCFSGLANHFHFFGTL